MTLPENLPENLTVSTKSGADTLRNMMNAGILNAAHFTNGTYAYAADLIVPTVLGGFEHAKDHEAGRDATLVIAVNSNTSMTAIMEQKIAKGSSTQAELDALEDQNVRALKVALPVAQQNPDRPVVVIFYDEDTPNALYQELDRSGLFMDTLFKWNYGTGKNTGVIEGAEFFNIVYGHPMPNDIQPVCADITRVDGQKGMVQVADLRGTYISADNKCMFTLLHPDLLQHGIRSNPAAPKASAPKPA